MVQFGDHYLTFLQLGEKQQYCFILQNEKIMRNELLERKQSLKLKMKEITDQTIESMNELEESRREIESYKKNKKERACGV